MTSLFMLLVNPGMYQLDAELILLLQDAASGQVFIRSWDSLLFFLLQIFCTFKCCYNTERAKNLSHCVGLLLCFLQAFGIYIVVVICIAKLKLCIKAQLFQPGPHSFFLVAMWLSQLDETCGAKRERTQGFVRTDPYTSGPSAEQGWTMLRLGKQATETVSDEICWWVLAAAP